MMKITEEFHLPILVIFIVETVNLRKKMVYQTSPLQSLCSDLAALFQIFEQIHLLLLKSSVFKLQMAVKNI